MHTVTNNDNKLPSRVIPRVNISHNPQNLQLTPKISCSPPGTILLSEAFSSLFLSGFCHNLGMGAAGIQWIETRGAAKAPYRVQEPLTTKNDPAPNVNVARLRKLA